MAHYLKMESLLVSLGYPSGYPKISKTLIDAAIRKLLDRTKDRLIPVGGRFGL